MPPLITTKGKIVFFQSASCSRDLFDKNPAQNRTKVIFKNSEGWN